MVNATSWNWIKLMLQEVDRLVGWSTHQPLSWPFARALPGTRPTPQVLVLSRLRHCLCYPRRLKAKSRNKCQNHNLGIRPKISFWYSMNLNLFWSKSALLLTHEWTNGHSVCWVFLFGANQMRNWRALLGHCFSIWHHHHQRTKIVQIITNRKGGRCHCTTPLPPTPVSSLLWLTYHHDQHVREHLPWL